MGYFSIPQTKTCNVIKKTLSIPKSQFFKPINPQNMKSKILKNLCYNNPTSLVRLVGGNNKEWKKELKIEEKVEQPEELEGIALGGDLDVALDKYNRCDCPIFLNPQTATFTDVAIHAKLRQRLQNGTINKHLRYARFMETHIMPVDFRNPTIENFIRHMDYREQVENASACALEHEWRAMQIVS